MEQSFKQPPGVTAPEQLGGLRELWAETTGTPEVCVAVLDGTVDLGHPCFRSASLQVADPLDRARVTDRYVRQHGTAIASLLFGQHASRLKGLVPRCRGLLIPIYRATSGGLSCTQEELARAIREAVRLGADVINVSGGELVPEGKASRELVGAVEYCTDKGRLLVAAAGNDGCAECLHVPAALPSVLVVGATESDGRPLDRSNWGKTYRRQGVVAPGRNLLIAAPGANYAVATGTSLATPLVSGVAALLASAQRLRGQRPDLRLVRQAILATASGCDEQPVDDCDRLLVGRFHIPRATSYFFNAMKGPPMTGTTEPVSEPSAVAPSAVGASTLSTGTAAPSGCPVAPQAFPSFAGPPIFAPAGSITPSILPSDCGCSGGNGKANQYVYVIGDRIGYDFGSKVRRLSISASADIGDARDPRPVDDPAVFLRHLLGSNKFPSRSQGNLADAKSVHWVLYQDECPRYVIEPHGCFCEAMYKALITALIDGKYPRFGASPGTSPLFADDPKAPGTSELLKYDCLKEYFDCYAGMQVPLVPPKEKEPVGKPESGAKPEPGSKSLSPQEAVQLRHAVSQLMGEEPGGRASKVAIAGTLANKRVTLASGQQVEVIYPELRGMSFWSTAALFESLNSGALAGNPDLILFVSSVVSRLYELARNEGKSPQQRAINWAATSLLRDLFSFFENPFFRQYVGDDLNAPAPRSAIRDLAVNDIQVRPSDCQESGGEYNVELSLFNFANTYRGLIVIAHTVEVSDEVPFALSPSRVFTKRG